MAPRPGAELEGMRRMIEQVSIGLKEAQRLVDMALHEAAKSGPPVIAVVVDRNGEPVCIARMDGTPGRTCRIAAAKAYSAARTGRSTLDLETDMKAQGRDAGYYQDPNINLFPGGIPLKYKGQVVGGLGISGRTADQDHALAAAVVALAWQEA
jgi:glc operon protein GlcG